MNIQQTIETTLRRFTTAANELGFDFAYEDLTITQDALNPDDIEFAVFKNDIKIGTLILDIALTQEEPDKANKKKKPQAPMLILSPSLNLFGLDWGKDGLVLRFVKTKDNITVSFFGTKVGTIEYRGKDKHAVFSVIEKTILSKDDNDKKNGESNDFKQIKPYLKNPDVDTVSLGGPLTWIRKYLDITTLAPHKTGGKKTITHYFPLSEDWSDLLLALYHFAVNMPPDDIFGCCHLYEQCSNTGRCLQGIDYQRSCSYAKNLKLGRIFYGSTEV